MSPRQKSHFLRSDFGTPTIAFLQRFLCDYALLPRRRIIHAMIRSWRIMTTRIERGVYETNCIGSVASAAAGIGHRAGNPLYRSEQRVCDHPENRGGSSESQRTKRRVAVGCHTRSISSFRKGAVFDPRRIDPLHGKLRGCERNINGGALRASRQSEHSRGDCKGIYSLLSLHRFGQGVARDVRVANRHRHIDGILAMRGGL